MSEHPTGTWSGELFGEMQFRSYLEALRRRKWWVVLTATAVFVATTVVAWRMPNLYRAETVILVDPQKVPDNYVPTTVSSTVEDRLSTIEQQLMSPSRLKRIIETMNLYPELRGRVSEQTLIRMMQKSTAITVVDSGSHRLSTFRIVFHGKNPTQTAAVANQLAKLFIDENSKVREQQFYETGAFMDREMRETKADLEKKEQELQRVKSQYILDLPESKQYHLEALTNYRNQLRASQDRVARAHQDKFLVQSLASAPTAVDLDAESSGTISPLQSQVQKLETQLAELRARYGPNYPDVRKLQARLDEVRAQMAAEEKRAPGAAAASPLPKGVRNPVLQGQLQKLDREITEQTKLQAQLQEQINFHLSKLERIPIFEQRIGSLMRDYDTLRGHYNNLLSKKLSADMASALETRQKGERFVVLDAAQPPEKPFAPNRPLLTLAGLLGGLLGGMGLAFVIEAADESVRSEREAALILGRPVLAGIPRMWSPQQIRVNKLRVFGAVVGTTVCSAVLGLLISRVSGWLF